MRDETVVFQVVRQIADLGEALAFHDKERTKHGFFRKSLSAGGGVWEFKIKGTKEFVVEYGNTLGCEQRHVLNNFLSVDSGQPLSVWFCSNSILPLRGSAFYTNE